MSVRAVVWAFNQKCPSPSAKLVLIKLADHADDEGRCWPSQSRVAADCGLSRETVNRQVKVLVGAGLITVEAQQDDRGRNASRYFLRCEQSSQASDVKAHASDDISHPPVISGHTPCDERSHKPSREPSDKPTPLNPPTRGRVSAQQEFEIWWGFCPRKIGKDAAARKYLAARKQASAETLLIAIQRFAANAPADKQFIAHPATWLHQGRWKDEDVADAPEERNTGPPGPPPKPEDLWPELRAVGD